MLTEDKRRNWSTNTWMRVVLDPARIRALSYAWLEAEIPAEWESGRHAWLAWAVVVHRHGATDKLISRRFAVHHTRTRTLSDPRSTARKSLVLQFHRMRYGISVGCIWGSGWILLRPPPTGDDFASLDRGGSEKWCKSWCASGSFSATVWHAYRSNQRADFLEP